MRVDESFKPFYYVHLLYFGDILPEDYQRAGMPGGVFRLHGPKDRISAPALLLRRTMVRIFHEGKIIWIKNMRPLPAGAELLLKLPSDGPGESEIYRIKKRL